MLSESDGQLWRAHSIWLAVHDIWAISILLILHRFILLVLHRMLLIVLTYRVLVSSLLFFFWTSDNIV